MLSELSYSIRKKITVRGFFKPFENFISSNSLATPTKFNLICTCYLMLLCNKKNLKMFCFTFSTKNARSSNDNDSQDVFAFVLFTLAPAASDPDTKVR